MPSSSKRGQALLELKKARAIIDVGENRALAIDGPVGHCREELTNDEFDEMWHHVEKAKQLLSPSKPKRTRFNQGSYPVKTL
jgi:hypothetical protein